MGNIKVCKEGLLSVKIIKVWTDISIQMTKNRLKLKNFEIDPILEKKFVEACGPANQKDVLTALIQKFVNGEIVIEVGGWKRTGE